MMKMEGIKARRHQGTNGAVVWNAVEGRASGAAAPKRIADGRQPTAPRASGGFTLIELLIAIAVLLVVIVATAQIFGTASKVAGTGQAAASVLQEAAVIERMMRHDIARLSPDGFFAIRQVALPNNVRGPGQPLLNPLLPPDPFDASDPNRHRAWIRCDQLVFFTAGSSGMQTLGVGIPGGGTASQGLGTETRVYYGHGFQLPDAPAARVQENDEVYARDPAIDVLPWSSDPTVDLVETLFTTAANAGGWTGTDVFEQSNVSNGPPQARAVQPESRRWLLTRQAVTLADDDLAEDQSNAALKPATNYKTYYLNNNRTARSIFRVNQPMTEHERFGWTNEVRNGRMDGAASRIADIWDYVRSFNSGGTNDWLVHRNVISQQAIYYPRAERYAPGPNRVDQALTNHVIGSAVSSFIVEWTWSDGVGDRYNENGELLCEFFDPPVAGETLPCNLFMNDCSGPTCNDRERFGFGTNWFPPGGQYEFQPEQPWFGINFPDRGVGFYRSDDYQELANFKRASTVWADNIEWAGSGAGYAAQIGPGGPPFETNVRLYEAIFGYNRNLPSAPNPSNAWFDEPHEELAYTPWPSAIRVTMVLHDTQGRMEHGREVQFVIELPKRAGK